MFSASKKAWWVSIKHRLKEMDRINSSITEFLDINKRICVTVLQMVEHINNWVFKDYQENKTNYCEEYSRLKNEMNYGWRESSQQIQDGSKTVSGS